MAGFPVPLNALRAIEIVARTGALKPAADELNVTIGAVSQHIRRAEARLGFDLFERTPHGLRPTAELEAVHAQLSNGFAILAGATRELTRGDDGVLTVTLGSVFASRWLIRRLPHFTAAHPELELRIVATGRLIDLAHSDIDCAIRYGDGRWPDLTSLALGCARFSPVCAPEMAARLTSPAALTQVPVIDDSATMLNWQKWFDTVGIDRPTLSGPRYTDPALAFDAAIAGQGALLAVDRMSDDAVGEGRLVRPFTVSAETTLDYWFVTSTLRRPPKKVQAFRAWLVDEMAKPASRSVPR